MDASWVAERVAALDEREMKADSDRLAPGRAAALRLARRLGCEGAHQMPDGSWQPCPTHEALEATVKNGAKGYERWRATNGTDTSFLAPHVKALRTALQRQLLVADQLTRVKAIGQAIGGGQARSNRDGVDHDGDGVIFDGTPDERSAPKKGSGNRAAAADAKKRRNARRDYLASRDTDKGPKATQANQREERLNRAVAREQLRGWEPTANGRGLRPAAGRRGAMGPAGPRSRQGAVSVQPGSRFSPSTRASAAEETRWAPGAADAPRGRGRKSADGSIGTKAANSQSTRAKPAERISGSSTNAAGSAGSRTAAREIQLTPPLVDALKKKVAEHNDAMRAKSAPSHRMATLPMLKAVMRRGMGAYSVSHRPNVSSRQQWAFARVNAFLKLLRSGTPSDPKYVSDNDLLPSGHERATR